MTATTACSVDKSATAIRLERVTKTYDNGVTAVDGVSLAIREGEFFSLLGPSGCGKTTTLRLIAGFEEPTDGQLFIRERDVTDTPPHRRDAGMVFQNYALFPHRTVFENVAFGLRMRKVERAEIARRVAAALALVELTGLEDRRPAQLSGGQQQRVALARAIVIEPTVLLCDEPLGALDKKLRQTMQFELKQLQRKIAVTLVYVTHDQEEALTMSDRIAVMNRGRIEQLGAPLDIYNCPATRFVSDFIGDSNLFDVATVERDAGRLRLQTADGLALLGPPGSPSNAPAANGRLALAVRPEKVRLAAAGAALDNRFEGAIESVNFLGGAILYRVALPNRRLILAVEPNDGSKALHAPGAAVTIGWAAADAVLLTE
jgi:putative spermidine/putrescine transport system ATP-binding protein